MAVILAVWVTLFRERSSTRKCLVRYATYAKSVDGVSLATTVGS